MQIYVCVKHVPDTAANIKVTEQTAFDDKTCKFVVNPYDEYAVEEAVQLVEKQGSGEVIIVTVGKEASGELFAAFAWGLTIFFYIGKPNQDQMVATGLFSAMVVAWPLTRAALNPHRVLGPLIGISFWDTSLWP